MIIMLSGGRSINKTAITRIINSLFLPGDYVRIIESYEYERMEKAFANMRATMTATMNKLAIQIRESGIFDIAIENVQSIKDKFEELKEEVYERYHREPLPRAPQIVSAFNVHEAYKRRLNYKPVYYHCRNNC